MARMGRMGKRGGEKGKEGAPGQKKSGGSGPRNPMGGVPVRRGLRRPPAAPGRPMPPFGNGGI
jgi:hypothetical protein